MLPRVGGQRVLAVRSEELDELPAFFIREARADTHMLEHARAVVKAEEK
jgi:hypothetical protein